jgi:hypothetical protein
MVEGLAVYPHRGGGGFYSRIVGDFSRHRDTPRLEPGAHFAA